ncbi:MAG: hypothetical protein H6608_07960 [Flavobacteriales bacterium]|nr:hypothetical protein [Flavobacteriales bacterium]
MFFTAALYAQEESSWRSKRLLVQQEYTWLDSQVVAPGSVLVAGYDSTMYRLSVDGHQLVWLTSLPIDSILVDYRVFPATFSDTFRRKDPKLIDAYFRENPFSYVPPSDRYLNPGGDDIRTLGNISRGVGFGNRQDVTVNSNLNLRLSGRIQNDVSILAAISDDNNPIQPEGNTQQIQDFDRVFVQLNKDSTQVIAGDFQMVTPEHSYFMKYNKKSRGGQFQHQTDMKKGTLRWSGEGAVSRGRFSRNTIPGIEGNQGPYRLSGANGELFIIIISGTEQVYLDGELLVRGEQNDYVIDYNTGEVTFMPSRLITQYSRIVVEFQYSDRNYARSVFRLGGQYEMDRWGFRLNYFSEQDNRNQPFQINLDLYDSLNGKSAREVLADAGDVEFAFISTVDSAGRYDPSTIQYYKKDSLGQSIFVHAISEQTGVTYYHLSFSYVGSGNGNYTQKISDANGKVFQWVEPVNGEPRGDYEPVEVLIAPERLQMVNLGVDYRVGENALATVELARSDNDLNTFSSLNSSDDVGYALKALFQQKGQVIGGAHPWTMESAVSYEHTQANFTYVERYRSVEFDRRWNRTLSNNQNQYAGLDEHILTADVYLHQKKQTWFRTNQTIYERGANQGGYASGYGVGINRRKVRAAAAADRVNTVVGLSNVDVTNTFSSYSGSLDYPGKRLSAGVSYRWESSDFGKIGDTLYQQSYRFEQRSVHLGSGDSSNWSWKLLANQRLDYQATEEGSYRSYTNGRDANLNVAWRSPTSTAIQFTGTYRELDFADSTSPVEQTVQGRMDLRQDLIKRVIQTQTYYQVGTGQEQRREYTYLEVGDGNGAYIWNDYDSNGVQSLNEFEIASEFDRGRANFIRQFLPVQGFIKAYSSELNTSIRIRPERVWNRKEVGLKRFMGRFSNVTSVKILKRITDNRASYFLNPFSTGIADTSLLSTNSVIRMVWSFNQSSPIFGIDYQWLKNDGKQLLINGVDSRANRENKLKVRYNIKRNWEINLTGNMGNRSYFAGFLTSRSFDYRFESIRPQLGYLYKQTVRVQVYYDYFEAVNGAQYGGERAFNHDFTTEVRLNFLNRGSVRFAIGMVDVNYLGNDNSPVAYELLAGLKNGRNAKWNLQVEHRFTNSIQVLISYDGRKSLDTPVIHIGRVQARYLF